MALSTVEVRPHSIKLTGQEQPVITSARSSDSAIRPAPTQGQGKAAPPSSYSVSSIMLSQGQQNATAVQIANKSLQFVGKELGHIKRALSQALTQGDVPIAELGERLEQSKKRIINELDGARYDGKRVIDNELQVKLDSADMRRFIVPGLNVNRLSERPEEIRLDFPQGRSVMIQFDGQSDGQRLVKQIDRILIPLGMRASLHDDGSVVFETDERTYKQMQNKVMVSGEGHRFPAGQANLFTVKPQPEGNSELGFNLASRDGIKRTIARVNQHLQQVQKSLEHAREFSSDLTVKMDSIQNQGKVLSTDEVNQALDTFVDSSGEFTSTYKALNAQANLRRHSVVALLK